MPDRSKSESNTQRKHQSDNPFKSNFMDNAHSQVKNPKMAKNAAKKKYREGKKNTISENAKKTRRKKKKRGKKEDIGLEPSPEFKKRWDNHSDEVVEAESDSGQRGSPENALGGIKGYLHHSLGNEGFREIRKPIEKNRRKGGKEGLRGEGGKRKKAKGTQNEAGNFILGSNSFERSEDEKGDSRSGNHLREHNNAPLKVKKVNNKQYKPSKQAPRRRKSGLQTGSPRKLKRPKFINQQSSVDDSNNSSFHLPKIELKRGGFGGPKFRKKNLNLDAKEEKAAESGKEGSDNSENRLKTDHLVSIENYEDEDDSEEEKSEEDDGSGVGEDDMVIQPPKLDLGFLPGPPEKNSWKSKGQGKGLKLKIKQQGGVVKVISGGSKHVLGASTKAIAFRSKNFKKIQKFEFLPIFSFLLIFSNLD